MVRLEDDPAGVWSRVVVADPYTFHEWEQAMAALFSQRAGEPALLLLIDARRASPPARAFVDGWHAIWQAHADRMRGGRVAVVVESWENLEIGRATERVAPVRFSFAFRVFHQPAEAEQWLAQEAESR
jgi:hypothetical protein